MSSYHRKYQMSFMFDQIKLTDTNVPPESFLTTPTMNFNEDNSIQLGNSIDDSNPSSPELIRKDSGTNIDFSSPEPLMRKIYRVNALRDKEFLSSSMDENKFGSLCFDDTASTPSNQVKRVVTSSVIVGQDPDINFDMSSIQIDEENSFLNNQVSRFVDSKELISPILYRIRESVIESSPRDEIFTKKLSPLPENIPCANLKLVGLHDSAPDGLNTDDSVKHRENIFNSMPLTLVGEDALNTPRPNPSKYRQNLATTFPYVNKQIINQSNIENCTSIQNDDQLTTVIKSEIQCNHLHLLNPESFNHWQKVIENMVLSETHQVRFVVKNVLICDSYTQTIPSEVYPQETLLNKEMFSAKEEESAIMDKLLLKLFNSGYKLTKEPAMTEK